MSPTRNSLHVRDTMDLSLRQKAGTRLKLQLQYLKHWRCRRQYSLQRRTLQRQSHVCLNYSPPVDNSAVSTTRCYKPVIFGKVERVDAIMGIESVQEGIVWNSVFVVLHCCIIREGDDISDSSMGEKTGRAYRVSIMLS